MSLKEGLRQQLKAITQSEGPVSRSVLFARLVLLFLASIWNLVYLTVSFILLARFVEYLDTVNLTGVGRWAIVLWSLITIVGIAVYIMVRALSLFGVWERK